MLRQDQIDILKEKYRSHYDELYRSGSYEEGHKFLLSWYRRLSATSILIHDSQWLAIDTFEELWRNERYPNKTTMKERREKKYNSPAETRKREAFEKKYAIEEAARMKVWCIEYIEHILENMERWKSNGNLERILNEERYYDVNFKEALERVRKYHGDDKAREYQNQHIDITQGLVYKSENRNTKSAEETRVAIFFDLLHRQNYMVAKSFLDDSILYNSEEDAKICSQAYGQIVK